MTTQEEAQREWKLASEWYNDVGNEASIYMQGLDDFKLALKAKFSIDIPKNEPYFSLNEVLQLIDETKPLKK